MTCGDPVGCACPVAWWGVVPPPCPVHNPSPFGTYVTRTLTYPPLGPSMPPLDGPRLTDDDVDRIARRVVELIGPRPPRVLPRREPHISPTLLDLADDDEPTPQGQGDDE